MRILLAHSFYRRSLPSGENDVVLEQLKLLQKEGYDIALWDPTSPEHRTSFLKLKTGIMALRGGGQDPLQIIKDFEPDLIHIHNLFPQIGTKWLKRAEVPTTLSIHNYRLVCASGILFRSGARCVDCLENSRTSAIKHKCYQDSRLATLTVVSHQQRLRHALNQDVDQVIFTSEFSREILEKYVQSRSVITLPNYVAPIAVKSESKFDRDPDYFVTIGRLSEEKGIAPLIESWPADKRLVIVGAGPQRDALHNLAKGKTIEFTGFVDACERDSLIAKSSGLVLPSITPEVDGLSVAQALSAGVPSIVRRGTASAALSEMCDAIQVFEDAATLETALDEVASNENLPTAARSLYRSRWSSDSWLKGFAKNVVGKLVNK